jgi:hypothetical protein
MEKTITINSASTTPDKKLTQLNTAKKAAIQSILEKYNLKTPKKSKTNAVPVNYEIKPKDDNQIIHVSKSIPSTPTYDNTIVKSEPRTTKSEPTSPIPRPSALAPAPAPIHPKPVHPSAQPSVPSGSSGSSILEKAKIVSVKDLLERDKAVKEAKKHEMPPAIINTNLNGGSRGANSEGQGGKLNIYNFIPKVQPSLPNTNTNTNKQVSSGGGNTISRGSNSNDSNNIKRVSINPNLNEEDSLNYNGRDSKLGNKSVNKADSGIATQVLQEAATARAQAARTPSPIRHIQQEKLNKQERIVQQPRTQLSQPLENRKIQIQSNSGGGNNKHTRAIKSMQQEQVREQQNQVETEGDNSGLRYLEAQRQELQRQQMLELQRFRHKKAEIIKLNNRKKEIELMRSIEAEKNKLRLIHAKQQELNEIYKSTVEKDTNNASMQNGGGVTMKRLVATEYDVDAKRTKKNLANKARNKIIEPTDGDHIKSSKLKGVGTESSIVGVVDKIVLEEDRKSKKPEKSARLGLDEVIEIIQDTPEIKANEKANEKANVKDKDNMKAKENEKFQSQNQVKKELVPDEPLKYYTKKDKKAVSISWPTKAELYDTNKFEESLDVFLGLEPFFNRKQIKNKATPEIIAKELKEEYGFQNLDKFKPELLNVIYKIIVGDRIKFTFA